jgi:MFS family permease
MRRDGHRVRTAQPALPRDPWLVFAAMALPVFALSMDVNGVGMLLPAIQEEFDVANGMVSWVVNASALTMGALMMPVGRIAPRLGNGRLVLIGVGIFTLASVVAGAAQSYDMLLAGRVGQGFGGVLTFATSLAVISSVFDEARRPAAVGAWGAVNGVGAALGPLVSGAMTSFWSWRGFFLINVPLGLVALVAIRRTAPPDVPTTDQAPLPWVRLGQLTVGIVLLTVGCQNTAEYGWLTWHTAGALVVGGALLLMLLVSGRRGAAPIVSPEVRRSPFATRASVVAFCSNWGFGVTVVAMGVYLQDLWGMTPLQAGLTFTVFSAMCAVAGAVVDRVTRVRGLPAALCGATSLAAVSLGAAALLTASAPLAAIAAVLAVGGLGQGLAFDLSSLAALEGVPDDHASEATSVVSTVRGFGLTTGVAISTTVSLSVGRAADTADPALTGFHAVMLLAAVVAAVGAAAAVWPTRHRPHVRATTITA